MAQSINVIYKPLSNAFIMKPKEIIIKKYRTEQTEEWKRIIIDLIKLNNAYRKKVSEREGFSQRRNLRRSLQK